ncbi:MAG: ABC transporter permease [Acidimicrobiales bacterium]|jgi:peptide/nickel transport system permease protein|nr:ABC transporter permease [Acidimicrobiales bacterium]
MRQLILQRLALLILVMFAVTIATFASINLSDTPLKNFIAAGAELDTNGHCDAIRAGEMDDTQQLGQNVGDCEYIDRIKAENNLDDDIFTRYGSWLGDIASGDLGTSTTSRLEVSSILKDRLPITIRLVVMTQIIAIGVAVPWGLAAAYRANRGFDRVSTFASFGLLSIPNFALAVILLYIFGIRLQWFPTRYSNNGWYDELKSLFIPAITLGVGLSATYQRLLRTDLITTLQDDFVHMARAKGMPDRHIMYRHALRPSMFSLVTVFGVNTGALLGGTLVIETIFSIPGVGRELVEAVIRTDPPVVMAFVAVIAAGFVIINFLVDLLYGWLDPRVRSS